MHLHSKVDAGRRLAEKRVKEAREGACIDLKYIHWFSSDVGFIGTLITEEQGKELKELKNKKWLTYVKAGQQNC